MKQTFDNTRALQEGWAVSETTGTHDDGDYRIERLDHSRIFLSDDDAWTHVINQGVFAENRYHLSALRFVWEHNPTEFDRIEAHAAQIGISGGLAQFFHKIELQEAA